MPDIHSFEPIWENWVLDEQIGRGSFGSVWHAHRQDPYSTIVQQAAIKHISIPPDNDCEAELFSDVQSLQHHCDAQLRLLTDEIETLIRLRDHANIVSFEAYKVVPKEYVPGYDLFVRMELLTSLPNYVRLHGMPNRDQVIKLGIDITKALEVLQKNHLIHRDVKPSNILVSANGNFKLGDFGTARSLRNDELSVTHTGALLYMVPEFYKGKTQFDQTVDLYSLGIVLYRYMNSGFFPFNSSKCVVLGEALAKRVQGVPMPPPEQADPALAQIILKACAFHPVDRYQTPTELREALEAVAKGLPPDAKT